MNIWRNVSTDVRIYVVIHSLLTFKHPLPLPFSHYYTLFTQLSEKLWSITCDDDGLRFTCTSFALFFVEYHFSTSFLFIFISFFFLLLLRLPLSVAKPCMHMWAVAVRRAEAHTLTLFYYVLRFSFYNIFPVWFGFHHHHCRSSFFARRRLRRHNSNFVRFTCTRRWTIRNTIKMFAEWRCCWLLVSVGLTAHTVTRLHACEQSWSSSSSRN